MSDLDLTELFDTFTADSAEDIAALEAGLLALEDAPNDGELPLELQRHAHSLKGNASCLGLQPITDFAHAYEHVLERIARGERTVDADLVTLLLAGIDTFRRLVDDRESAVLLPPDRELMERLDDAALTSAYACDARPAASANSDAAKPVLRAQSVRVSAAKLNRMLDLTGEIAVARGRVRDIVSRTGDDELVELERQAGLLQAELQELVMRARMVPVGSLFRQYARTVRDLSVAQGKITRLVTTGDDVDLDTSAVELLRDPLTHMIRNAIDHGVELPADRIAAGKQPVGRITLEAKHDAGSVVIRVSDDGAGLDRDAIRARAGSSAESDGEIFDLIFAPGFSTSETVTEISGRGVGMDVVRRAVESLRGTIGVESRAGAGTTFIIRLPLTLAVIEGFGVTVGGETYLVPMDHVVECVELPGDHRDDGTGVLLLRNEVVPFIHLRHHFGVPGASPERENVLIVQHEGAKAGLAVDALHGASQTVIKPLGDYFPHVPGVAGSSILGNGRVALILDTPGILRSLVGRAHS